MANRPSLPDDAEIAAVFERLRGEVGAARPAADGPAPSPRASTTDRSLSVARDQAERFWAVTADRPYLYKPGAWGRIRGLLLVPLKAVLRRLMRWYVEPALAQQRDFNASVLRALDELSERVDGVAGELDAAVDDAGRRLEAGERARVDTDERLLELDERLVRVERRTRQAPAAAAAAPSGTAEVGATDADGADYFAFESRMRGSTELIRERQSVYLDDFRTAAPVLDIGCGRGEFLTLLREAGVEARGIDVDAEMVTHCREEGLEVEQADGLSHLASLEDDALGGIFCAHVLEHLSSPALFRLLELAVAKLRPGGVFAAETPNPLSLVALANFTADLSHDRPLHPATLSFLARQAGFRNVELRFLSEPSEAERLKLVPLPDGRDLAPAKDALDANVNRLNDVVFGPQDYAVVATT
jgi:2-polyprenyl-3-methyl-5-hydroxy-6-metoxy-1,4-benzoquinol methylase